MKEQDYMKIMNELREDYISEAVSWDASAQKNRRSIKRLSLGIGAIAAALAVVIGGIGYSTYRDRLTGNQQNSDVTEEKCNILGGQGEIRGYLGTQSGWLFRDDMYFYSFDKKWRIDGSSGLLDNEHDFLLTDGERIYIQHDNTLYITDSYGRETAFYTAETDMKFEAIRSLGGGNYWIAGVKTTQNPEEYDAVLPHSSGGFGVNFTALLNPEAKTLKETNGYITDIRCSTKRGGLYWYSPETRTVNFMPGDDPTCCSTVYSGVENAEDWGIDDENGLLLYETLRRHDTDAGADTWAGIYTLVPDDAENKEENGFSYRGDYPAAEPDPANDYPCFSYFSEQYLYGAMQKQTDTGLVFRVMRRAYDAFDGNQTVFEVPVAELYGSNPPDRMRKQPMGFLEAGEYLLIGLPQTGIHGEDIVQVNLETGAWFCLGENYHPEQTEQPDGSSAETAVEEGYCSPEKFAQYYIPPENVAEDLDKIECYRMLPFAKASESKLDTEALGAHLPEGGTWSRRDPDASRMDFNSALAFITTGGPISGWDIMAELCKLNAGYDAEAYLYNNMLSDREFWLRDDGKDFFYVLLYGPDNGMGDIDRAEFYYFNYDDEKKQYHYMYLPDRSTSGGTGAQNPAKQQTEGDTNILGGKGTVHPYLNSRLLQYAEDDEWYYDLVNVRRARKNPDVPRLQYERLPEEVIRMLYPDNELSLLTDGTDLYKAEAGTVYRILPDGTWASLADLGSVPGEETLQKDSVRIKKLHRMRDNKLFVLADGTLAKNGEARLNTYLIDIVKQKTVLLTSSADSAQELNKWESGCYTEDYVYTVTDNGGMLNLLHADGVISLDLALTADVHLTGDKWFVGGDGKLWFIRQDGWYQMELDDRKDGYLQPKHVSENVPHFEVCEPVPGTMKMLTYLSAEEKTGMVLCDYDGSGAYEMLQISPCRILGAYCDGGVYHIAAEVGWAADAPDPELPPEIVFITKDGSSISSVAVPKE